MITSPSLPAPHPTSMTVAVSGASGYVGRAVIAGLSEGGEYRVSALRRSSVEGSIEHGLRNVQGDLLQPQTLNLWLERGCTVVHLAYMWAAGPEENLRATQNLVEACAQAGVARLVHVSTAAVIGRAASAWVDEQTPCQPSTEYGQTKLHIERVLREGARHYGFDLVVLRPTAVYGPSGAPLQKLCRDLREAYWLKNYLKACLFGRRAMNLVHIDNVVAAVRFVVAWPQRFAGATYIVSEDEHPKNNFHDVESAIRTSLGLSNYPLPVLPLPSTVLSMILRALRRNIVDPGCRFSSDRLRSLGFMPSRTFDDGLKDYLNWCRRAGMDHIETNG